jgi:hypothetical protein
MEQKSDYYLVGIIFIITAIVFWLDLVSPLGMAIWALYVLPLGLTRWSIFQPLTLIVGGICSVLIVAGYFFSPGPSSEIAMVNRGLGFLMVLIVVFFLLADR